MSNLGPCNFLLARISEESSELITAAAKAQIYGPLEQPEGSDQRHIDNIVHNLNQTVVAVKLLLRELKDQGYEVPEILNPNELALENEAIFTVFNRSVKLGIHSYSELWRQQRERGLSALQG